jgi:hypothetical protein
MLIADNITRKEAMTPEALADERERMVSIYAGEGIDIAKFTCDDCGARFTCLLAFDAYNTDGDCLAEK